MLLVKGPSDRLRLHQSWSVNETPWARAASSRRGQFKLDPHSFLFNQACCSRLSVVVVVVVFVVRECDTKAVFWTLVLNQSRNITITLLQMKNQVDFYRLYQLNCPYEVMVLLQYQVKVIRMPLNLNSVNHVNLNILSEEVWDNTNNRRKYFVFTFNIRENRKWKIPTYVFIYLHYKWNYLL